MKIKSLIAPVAAAALALGGVVAASAPASALANGYTKITLSSGSVHYLDLKVSRKGSLINGRINPGGSWTGNGTSTDTIGEPLSFNLTAGYCARQVVDGGYGTIYSNGNTTPGQHWLVDGHVNTVYLTRC